MFSSLLICEIGKCGQRVAPHGIDVGTQLSQAFGIETKVMTSAAPLFLHQPGGLQHLQMLGHGRTADGKLGSQFAHRGRALPQQVEHGLAGRIGEGAQQLRSVSHTLP